MSDEENRPVEEPLEPQKAPTEASEQLPEQRSSFQTPKQQKTHLEEPTEQEEQFYKCSRRFVYASALLGLISFFFGSLVFSIIGLICGIAGYRRLKRFAKRPTTLVNEVKYMKTLSQITIVICAVGIIFSFVVVMTVVPYIYEIISTGEFEELLNSTPATNDTWG